MLPSARVLALALSILGLVPSVVLAAPSLETCLSSPSSADCSSFEYPSTSAQTALLQLCTAKPQLSACTTYKVCQNQLQASTLGGWCDTFTLLGSACADTAQISGAAPAACSEYNKLCASGSVVPKCKTLGTMYGQGWVNTTYAQFLINSMCNDMEMIGCNCTTTDNSINPTCETLTMFSEMCVDMSSMRQCSVWRSMCSTTSNSCFCTRSTSCTSIIGVLSSASVSSSSGSSSSSSPSASASSSSSSTLSNSDWESAPAMSMFFHSGLAEYFLFKGWVPRNAWQYAGSLVAVFLMAFIFEGVVVWREVLEHNWGVEEEKRIKVGDAYWRAGFFVDVKRFSITCLSVGLGYWIMLLAMTFNAGVFVCCIVGIAVGSVVFRKFKPVEARPTGLQECC